MCDVNRDLVRVTWIISYNAKRQLAELACVCGTHTTHTNTRTHTHTHTHAHTHTHTIHTDEFHDSKRQLDIYCGCAAVSEYVPVCVYLCVCVCAWVPPCISWRWCAVLRKDTVDARAASIPCLYKTLRHHNVKDPHTALNVKLEVYARFYVGLVGESMPATRCSFEYWAQRETRSCCLPSQHLPTWYSTPVCI